MEIFLQICHEHVFHKQIRVPVKDSNITDRRTNFFGFARDPQQVQSSVLSSCDWMEPILLKFDSTCIA